MLYINRAQISINGESEKYQENNTEILLQDGQYELKDVIIKIYLSKFIGCYEDLEDETIDNLKEGDIVDFKLYPDAAEIPKIQYNGQAKIIGVGKPDITLYEDSSNFVAYRVVILKLIDAKKLSKKLSKYIDEPSPKDLIWEDSDGINFKKNNLKIYRSKKETPNYYAIITKLLWITIALNILSLVLNIIRLHLLTGG